MYSPEALGHFKVQMIEYIEFHLYHDIIVYLQPTDYLSFDCGTYLCISNALTVPSPDALTTT